jgi:hypothetical protein
VDTSVFCSLALSGSGVLVNVVRADAVAHLVQAAEILGRGQARDDHGIRFQPRVTAAVDAKVQHGWNHSLGEIVTLLARNGLHLQLPGNAGV